MYANKYQEIVVERILEYGQCSTQSIYESLQSRWLLDISLSQFYKVIDHLIDDHVLLKEKWQLSLNEIWLDKVRILADRVERYKKSQSIVFPFNHWWNKRVYANSLKELDSIWVEMYTKIINDQTPKHVYFYDSHLYFLYWSENTELSYYKITKEKWIRVHQLIWNSVFLDTLWKSMIENITFDSWINSGTLLPDTWYYCAVIWDYVIDVVIPSSLLQLLDEYYTSIENEVSFDKDWFEALFRLKTKCSMTIRHDKELSKSYKVMIEEWLNNKM